MHVCVHVCVRALVTKPTVLVSTYSDRNQRGIGKDGNKEGEKKGEGA